MKTFVVNMLKDTEKRATIEKQLANHPELDYQIWEAVEGRKLSEQEQKKMILPEFFERYGRNATLPAVGCSLSHIGIYRDMISYGIEYALILEDDAILPPSLDFSALLPLLQKEEPVAIILTPKFWYRKENKVLDLDKSHSCYTLADSFMTSGYLINKAACELLVPKIYPVRYTADAWRQFVDFGLHLYGVVPHLISFPDGIGEIGRSQHVHKNLYEKCRAMAVEVYIRLLWTRLYLKGNRRSFKKWK